jgi:ankyrin repeat protein
MFRLILFQDFTTGYTGLHWACKYGNMDMIKLLAGAYNAHVNVRYRTEIGYVALLIG